MDARTSRKQKKLSKAQEARIAKDIGGRVQPGSGSVAGFKGDVRKMGELRIEAKFTRAESYKIKLQELEKIETEAGLERPVLQLCFLNRRNHPICSFAISPTAPLVTGGGYPWTTYETYSKTITVARDLLELQVHKSRTLWITFAKKNEEYKWYLIQEWTDFVDNLESL